MFGHPLRKRLPELLPKPNKDTTLRKRDNDTKQRMKANTDNRDNVNKKPISLGDTVLVKYDGHISKNQTPYDTQLYTVTKKKASMIIASCGHHSITRNSSFSLKF